MNLGDPNIKSIIEKKSLYSGWLISLALFITILVIYISSIKYTIFMNDGLFQYRAWNWVQYFIGFCSLATIGIRFKEVKVHTIICGVILGALCWVSFFLWKKDMSTSVMNGVIAFLAFIAGCMLKSNENGIGSLMNEGNIKKAFKSFLWGSAISIPFATINVVYFVVAEGPLKLQNPFVAAFFSLEPGISEEIIFRFFIINAASAILRNKLSQKSLIFVVIFLAVVPHSIIHYPDLWIKSLPSAIFMFFSTSLLFGLPMTYIQYKKNLESAIGFHWFIDFIRFFAGF